MKKCFIELVVISIVSLGFAIVAVEWFAGCGETYIAADGKRYANECVFVGN